MIRSLALIAALLMVSGCGPGCLWLLGLNDDDDESWDDDEWDDDEWEEEEIDEPPTLDIDIDAPNGIMGPDSTVTVNVDDDDTLQLDVSFAFARSVERVVERGQGTTVTGAELGEGYGSLAIDVSDADGGFTSTSVDGLLVDLSPPLLELEPCILAASGKGDRGTLAAWVGDAWALGSVTVEVVPEEGDALVLGEAFGEWPSTFGETWDWSYFSVGANELPVGRSLATYTVRDRAGNSSTRSCDLLVDALPPVVTLQAQLVDGFIYADVTAVDDDDTALPNSLTLYAGGTEAAHGQAPSTSFVLDAADFPSGALPLEARATDRAGNEGRSAVVLLTL